MGGYAMPDKVLPGPIHGTPPSVKEAVCIHANKIYDSCRDKECIEDIRVFPTRCSQAIIDKALSVKCRCAELIYTDIDVNELCFNRGFFTVDIRFFYRITADAYLCAGKPVEICGVCSYDKRVILYGGEGSARIFSSKFQPNFGCGVTTFANNLPTAIVETEGYNREDCGPV